MTRFPGAPRGSYVSEEGWLVTDTEAWTEHEWATARQASGKSTGMAKGRRIVYDDDRHRQWREGMRRYRARRRSAA